MLIKDVLIEINEDVKDIINLGFELTKVQSDYVPHPDDQGLSFESGRVKRAKLIETCVLYADIRNSTLLSQEHSKEVMARLYSAFTSSMIYVAQHHGGIVRNIIGDRVMIVFPPKDCFTKAINTAISINTVASRIMDKHFKGFNFKVGIGIDYGEMKVIKAGITKQGKERATHKNLVWIGNAANIASKLTDVANKNMVKDIFKVTKQVIKLRRPDSTGSIFPFGPPSGIISQETIEVSKDDFLTNLKINSNGDLIYGISRCFGFEKVTNSVHSKPILISQRVWEEYSKLNSKDIKDGHWEIQNVAIKEYTGQIWGANLVWTVSEEI